MSQDKLHVKRREECKEGLLLAIDGLVNQAGLRSQYDPIRKHSRRYSGEQEILSGEENSHFRRSKTEKGKSKEIIISIQYTVLTHLHAILSPFCVSLSPPTSSLGNLLSATVCFSQGFIGFVYIKLPWADHRFPKDEVGKLLSG